MGLPYTFRDFVHYPYAGKRSCMQVDVVLVKELRIQHFDVKAKGSELRHTFSNNAKSTPTRSHILMYCWLPKSGWLFLLKILHSTPWLPQDCGHTIMQKCIQFDFKCHCRLSLSPTFLKVQSLMCLLIFIQSRNSNSM